MQPSLPTWNEESVVDGNVCVFRMKSCDPSDVIRRCSWIVTCMSFQVTSDYVAGIATSHNCLILCLLIVGSGQILLDYGRMPHGKCSDLVLFPTFSRSEVFLNDVLAILSSPRLSVFQSPFRRCHYEAHWKSRQIILPDRIVHVNHVTHDRTQSRCSFLDTKGSG
jgi:hypothetical protein